ncbi:uncharacterized protein LOC128223670 isoform X1 [Mya arenaria]|uniref:uncharacterized protein LOC128223670 isoform X1 n=1 Tax=Mya arenaria TaxID=6604 RepID=UPI0022E914D4|nr:uncharacterized protein LOC128223670 isoform X1 [Mya arenaria]XP_052788918.1 uncharacterized protein LOC128223670 isoform X1 [Mya arenaria]
MLSEWTSRLRLHNWPSPELIQEISELPAYLVPVGCKNSKNKHMEWRVCFIGEQKLTSSFTECQYKLYIIFKFLMKEELKSICDEMSSYIVKNIVFWFIESTQQELFSKENMIEHLLSCLQMLQQAIRDNHLPYYMIPGRNLLIERINQLQQQQLIAKLDALIQEGPRVILRCPKVLEALYNMSPTELTKKGHWRDKLEKLWLEWQNIVTNKDEDGKQLLKKDPYFITVTERMYDTVWPLWRLYQKEGILDIVERKIYYALL